VLTCGGARRHFQAWVAAGLVVVCSAAPGVSFWALASPASAVLEGERAGCAGAGECERKRSGGSGAGAHGYTPDNPAAPQHAGAGAALGCCGLHGQHAARVRHARGSRVWTAGRAAWPGP